MTKNNYANQAVGWGRYSLKQLHATFLYYFVVFSIEYKALKNPIEWLIQKEFFFLQ